MATANSVFAVQRHKTPGTPLSPGASEAHLTSVNPGFCYGDVARDVEGVMLYFVSALQWILARKTEVGSRALDAGACAGTASQGQLYGGLQELEARRTDLDC